MKFISAHPVFLTDISTAIARNMQVGRQEDAHEFLRFSLDRMQEASAKNANPPARTDVEKEHTFMNRIFGGKFRSRVTCSNCSHDSDTFDGFMDISLDVSRAGTVKEAFQAFVKVDALQGANRYQCEECKKLVNAKKQFTISQAPQILHVHLKRFTPSGKKISGAIGYQETLSLGDYMSEDSGDVGMVVDWAFSLLMVFIAAQPFVSPLCRCLSHGVWPSFRTLLCTRSFRCRAVALYE